MVHKVSVGVPWNYGSPNHSYAGSYLVAVFKGSKMLKRFANKMTLYLSSFLKCQNPFFYLAQLAPLSNNFISCKNNVFLYPIHCRLNLDDCLGINQHCLQCNDFMQNYILPNTDMYVC